MAATDTTSEIEDVLASIRRLVSQEDQPAKVSPPPAAEDDGFLVLTPEQRISRRVAEAVATREMATPQPQSLTDELSRLESTIAELEAAVSAARERAAEEDAEEAPFVDLSDTEDVTAEVTYLPGARAQDPAQQDDDSGELTDLVPEEPGETEAVAGEDTTDDTSAGEPEPEEKEEEEEEEISPEEPLRPRTIVRGGSIADEDFDADLEEDDAPDVIGIDEEMLREMVAQMIREELRGVLGERITSNVRKLVRREIQRALRDELPE